MARTAFIATGLLALSAGVFAYDDEFFSAPELSYPVVTESMVAAIGEIDIVLSYKPFRSIAIVGADEISAHWLQMNNDYLVSINALGLVINVESPKQLDILRRYTDIPLVASPAYDLADRFGRVYPILIDATAARVRQ